MFFGQRDNILPNFVVKSSVFPHVNRANKIFIKTLYDYNIILIGIVKKYTIYIKKWLGIIDKITKM